MSQPASSAPSSFDRFRERFGSRAGGLIFALLIEGLVVLMLLTLAPTLVEREKKTSEMTVFSTPPPPPPPPPAKEAAPAASSNVKHVEVPVQAPPSPTAAVPDPVSVVTPEPPALLNIPLNRIPDIATLPRGAPPAAPRGPAAGPPNLASLPGDTPRVAGRGPGGEALYAARWVREPYPSETLGYLSTAQGPGWALIACRTVADFRIEDCVKLDEYPEGSNIARAVIAASWQFRVRPPRLGGQNKVGEWIRIKYDYGIKRESER